MFKKVLLMILASVMIVSACACGNGGIGKNNGNNGVLSNGPFKMYGADSPVELGVPEFPVDAKTIMKEIKCVPQMFYGTYKLLGGETAQSELPEKVGCYPDYTTEYGKQISLFPFKMVAGKHNLTHRMCDIKEHEWMRLYFQVPEGYLTYIDCAFEIEGNKLKCYPLETFEYLKESASIRYSLSDFCFEYEFELDGLDIILSKNGKNISLRSGLGITEDINYFVSQSYVSKDSPKIANISCFSFRYTEAKDENKYIRIEDENKNANTHCAAEFNRDGLFTLTVPEDGKTVTYQFAFRYCGDDGLVFTDGNTVYYYNESYFDRYCNDLNDNITAEDIKKLENMDKDKVEEIIEKKDDLFEDLAKAFAESGIAVKVNKDNGEMAMDASVLFGGDSAVITEEGKELLNKFLAAYTSIIYNDKYNGFIAKTVIEGHTAPLAGSTYESGLPLSEKRAENVKNYCLSPESGVDTSKLSETLVSVGLSNSKPIYIAEGTVDLAACRRVSFRFILNIE